MKGLNDLFLLDCGVREALDSIDVPKDEQERILEIIHGVRRSEDV